MELLACIAQDHHDDQLVNLRLHGAKHVTRMDYRRKSKSAAAARPERFDKTTKQRLEEHEAEMLKRMEQRAGRR